MLVNLGSISPADANGYSAYKSLLISLSLKFSCHVLYLFFIDDSYNIIHYHDQASHPFKG